MKIRQKLALRAAVGILRLGGLAPYFDARVSSSKKNVFGARVASASTREFGEFLASLTIPRPLATDEVLTYRMHVDLRILRQTFPAPPPTLQERIEAAGPGNVVMIEPGEGIHSVKPRIVAGAMTGGRLHQGALAAMQAVHACDKAGAMVPNPDGTYSPTCSLCHEAQP